MIYVLAYRFEGLTGPAGFCDVERGKVLAFAERMAVVAISFLNHDVATHTWVNLDGTTANPRQLLRTGTPQERLHCLQQIDVLLGRNKQGYLLWREYEGIDAAIVAHRVREWCSEGLRMAIDLGKTPSLELVRLLADEWMGGECGGDERGGIQIRDEMVTEP